VSDSPVHPTAVTGATGAVGGLVARDLAARGVSQRLLVRRPDKAPDLAGAAVVPCAYGDQPACGEALRGVQTLFMVSGAEAADRLGQHRRFVDTAAEAGVAHVVYTSFLGAAPDCTFTLGRDHFATEQHIRASGMAFTFLRNSFYLDVFPHFVGEDGVLRGPAGEGRVAAVARTDVARVAVEVLLDPARHRGATYDLTGPEALTMAEVAATISRVTGRDVTYHDETVEEAYASRRRWEAPQWEYDAWVSTYTAIAGGELDRVSDDVERVTGSRPVGLAEVLRAGRRP
jgi:NAD(P)H dehydrogenase (quinone)